MAVKKTATKAPAKPAAKKAAAKPAAKKAAPKASAKKAESTEFNIEIDANPAMGAIVVEALKSEYFENAADEMKEFFEKEEVSDIDVQSLLFKIFIQGAIAGAAIAADDAQKGFEELAAKLQKLTKKK